MPPTPIPLEITDRQRATASEEELALRARGGCLASLDELVRRLQVPLVRFLSRRTARLGDAEDLAQETWVRAYRGLASYESRGRFRAWLLTIAHRLSLNHHRRAPREQELAEPESVSRTAPSASDALEAAESRQTIWSTAARVLDEEQVAALWLYYVEELSTEEVAGVLGRSRSAIKTMLFRARQELSPHLTAAF